MENLIVGVDGSEVSLRAAKQALVLAKAYGAKVTLLNVVNPIVLSGDTPWASLELLERSELERGQQLVHEARLALGEEAGELVKVGPVADTLVEVARTMKDSMIVVGSTGKGAVKRMLVGSVADRVVHLSAGPVLVMR